HRNFLYRSQLSHGFYQAQLRRGQTSEVRSQTSEIRRQKSAGQKANVERSTRLRNATTWQALNAQRRTQIGAESREPTSEVRRQEVERIINSDSETSFLCLCL